MKKYFTAKEITIAEQVSSMRRNFPQFKTEFTTHSSMKVIGALKPTARSLTYDFTIRYDLKSNPHTNINKPQLEKNSRGEDIPHLYPDGSLCLFHPHYSEFTRANYISEKIIGWISLWLYYYEDWHLTYEWAGGGEHPLKLKPKKNEKTR